MIPPVGRHPNQLLNTSLDSILLQLSHSSHPSVDLTTQLSCLIHNTLLSLPYFSSDPPPNHSDFAYSKCFPSLLHSECFTGNAPILKMSCRELLYVSCTEPRFMSRGNISLKNYDFSMRQFGIEVFRIVHVDVVSELLPLASTIVHPLDNTKVWKASVE